MLFLKIAGLLRKMFLMPNKSRLLFFDTVVLSNFAFASQGFEFLTTQYASRGRMTVQVFQEIMKAIYLGYNRLESLVSEQSFQKVILSEEENIRYFTLLKNLGEGEASCLAAAASRDGIVVTDDFAARNCCREMDLPVTGTIGILKAACLKQKLRPDEADRMLQEMVECGYYSPVNRISDLL